MKKIILPLTFLMVCATQGYAKTIFVEKYTDQIYAKVGHWPTMSDTIYDSISDVIDQLCDEGDTLILGGGPIDKEKRYEPNDLSFSGGILLNRTLNFRGTNKTDPEFALHGGSVILSGEGSADYIIYISSRAQNSSVSSLKFTHELSGPAVYSESDSLINDVKIDGCRNGIISKAGTKINRVDIHNCADYSLILNSNEKITYCTIRNGRGVLITYNSSPVFTNCLIAGQAPYALILGRDSHAELNNSILHANGSYWYNEYIINNYIDATAILDHCIILPSPFQTDIYYRYPNNITEIACKHETPLFKKSMKPSLVIFGSDDASNIDYYIDVIKPALEQYGWKGVMAFNGPSRASQVTWSKLRALVEDGHQIANHADLFSRNVQNHRGIIIYYENNANETVSIEISDTNNDGYAENMIFWKNGQLDSLIDDTGIINFDKYQFNRIGKICDYLNDPAIEGYRCILQGEYTAGSKYLPDIEATELPSRGLSINLSSERVWNGELRDPKVLLEQHLGVGSITGWVGPGNGTSSAMREKLVEFGYLGGRGGYPDSGSITFETFNVFNFYTHALGAIAKNNNPSIEDIKARWGSQFAWLKYHGGVLYYYAHKLSEFDENAWHNLLSEVSRNELTVLTLEQASHFVRTYNPLGDLTTEDGQIFKRSVPEQGNFHFTWHSPCLNGGVKADGVHDNENLAYDIDGTQILNQPDIGPYEYPYASGDYDWDGDKDGIDIGQFIYFYSNSNLYADINNDQIINNLDIKQLAQYFGQ